MRILLALFLTVTAAAQSLEITPSSAGRGDSGSLLIRLAVPADMKIASMQWQMRVPVEVVIDSLYIVAGSAAVSADKTLTCIRAKKSDRNHAVFSCLIYGGVKTIAGGAVAVVQYQISPRAKGSMTVAIDNAMAASPDAQGTVVPPAQGTITLK